MIRSTFCYGAADGMLTDFSVDWPCPVMGKYLRFSLPGANMVNMTGLTLERFWMRRRQNAFSQWCSGGRAARQGGLAA